MAAEILIIEDNAPNLDLMCYLLERFGHSALRATDGHAGWSHLNRKVPDLAVCDIQLPGIDGYEIARRARQDPRLKEMPLLAVTAYAMVGDRDKVLASGFHGYIAKPIEPTRFVPYIESFLPAALRTNLESAAEQSALQNHVSAPARTRGCVLVVDNLAVNRDLAKSMLEPLGYEVLVAHTTARAMESAEARVPDLILSDVGVVGGSGFDFLRYVRSSEKLARVPFILISAGYDTAQDREQGLRSGADMHLFRPIEPRALLDAIEKLFERRR